MMKLSAANFKKHITLQKLDLNVEALQGIVHAGNNYDFVDTFEADRLWPQLKQKPTRLAAST